MTQSRRNLGHKIRVRMTFNIHAISETCLMTEIRAASSFDNPPLAKDAVLFSPDFDAFSSDLFEILFDESFAATVRRLSKYL